MYGLSTLLRTFSLLFLSLISLSCTSTHADGQELFINKFQNNEFNIFHNKSIFIRGGDGKGNSILFILDDDTASHCQSPSSIAIASVSYGNHKINYFDYKLTNPRCSLFKNDEHLNFIIAEFMKYDIGSITVDGHDNVFIGLDTNERMGVAKLVAPEHVSRYVKENLVRVQGNWYKRIKQ